MTRVIIPEPVSKALKVLHNSLTFHEATSNKLTQTSVLDPDLIGPPTSSALPRVCTAKTKLTKDRILENVAQMPVLLQCIVEPKIKVTVVINAKTAANAGLLCSVVQLIKCVWIEKVAQPLDQIAV
jgi:hypothetical protein